MNNIKTYANVEYDADIRDYIHHFGEKQYCDKTINDRSFLIHDKDSLVNCISYRLGNYAAMEMLHRTGTPETYNE
jgi:hypothetical protein